MTRFQTISWFKTLNLLGSMGLTCALILLVHAWPPIAGWAVIGAFLIGSVHGMLISILKRAHESDEPEASSAPPR